MRSAQSPCGLNAKSPGALTLEPPARYGYELLLHTCCRLASCTWGYTIVTSSLPSFPIFPGFTFFPSVLPAFVDLLFRPHSWPWPHEPYAEITFFFFSLLELLAMDVSPRLHCGDIWHAAAGQGSTSLVLSTGSLSSHF